MKILWTESDLDKALFFKKKKQKKNDDIFLISPQKKHMLWYSLEVPQQGASDEYPQRRFSWRDKKNIFLILPFILSYELNYGHPIAMLSS